MRSFCIYILLAVCFKVTFGFGQDKTLDSLEIELKNTKNDTAKCMIFDQMSAITYKDDKASVIDRFFKFTEERLSKNPPENLKPRLLQYHALAMGYIGYREEEIGNPNKAIEWYKKCLSISETIKDDEGIAHACHNLGASYKNTGNVVKALEYFHRALMILEKQNNKLRIAGTLNSIAMIYDNQGDSASAMSYYLKALKIRYEIGDSSGISNSYNCIGQLYHLRGHVLIALEYFEKAYLIRERMGDPVGMATALNNIASVYEKQKKNKEALTTYKNSLELYMKANYIRGIVPSLINLSVFYCRTGNNKDAERLALQALEIANKIRAPQYIRTAAFSLSKIYKATNRPEQALKNYELYIQMRDSLNNESTRKASIKSQLKYEYEKQAAADSVAHAKESEIKNVELKRQAAEIKAKKNQQYALFGGLFFVCLFGAFMYNRFKITQKQKAIIEQQKEVVEEQKKIVDEKQKEILDSIRYAKRIQLAQIPNEKVIEKNLERLKSRPKS